jgi:chromosome segregation ATPase
MSAYGATVQAAREAAERLAAQGRTPSVRAIREVLGGQGGSAQIAEGQRRWLIEAAQRATLRDLPEDIATLFGQLWDATRAQAAAHWETERADGAARAQALETARVALEAELAAARAAHTHMEVLVGALRGELLDAQDAHAQALATLAAREQARAQATAERDALAAQGRSRQVRLEQVQAEQQRANGRADALNRLLLEATTENAALHERQHRDQGTREAQRGAVRRLGADLKRARGQLRALEGAATQAAARIAELEGALAGERRRGEAQDAYWQQRLSEAQDATRAAEARERAREQAHARERADLRGIIAELRQRQPGPAESDGGRRPAGS